MIDSRVQKDFKHLLRLGGIHFQQSLHDRKNYKSLLQVILFRESIKHIITVR